MRQTALACLITPTFACEMDVARVRLSAVLQRTMRRIAFDRPFLRVPA
jgi:hypothetical protein